MKLYFKEIFTAFCMVGLIACSPAEDTVVIKVNTAIPVRPPVSLSSKLMDFMSVTINEDCYQQNIRLVVHDADTDQNISSKKILMRSRYANPVPTPTPAYTSNIVDIDKVVSQLRYYTYFDEPLSVEVVKNKNLEIGIIGNFLKPVDLNKDGICDAEDTSISGLGNYWTMKPNLTNRMNHTLSLRLDGSVLAVGGTTGTLNNTELYAPLSNSWIPQPALPEATPGNSLTARSYHTATVLNDGRVLVIGGSFNGTAAMNTDNVMVFNTNGTWSALPNNTNAERFKHTATKLPDGRVVIIGGKDLVGGASASASIFDPSDNSWSVLTASAVARYSHTATYLSTGQILVVGGSTSADIGLADYQLLTLSGGGTWTASSQAGGTTTLRLRHTATALNDGRVLIAGGDNNGTETNNSKIFTPPSTWSADISMPLSNRSKHQSVLLPDGKVLVFGGTSVVGATTLDTTIIFDPVVDQWASLPEVMFQAVSKAASVLLPDGKIMVTGGDNSGARQYTEVHTLTSAGLHSSSLIGHASVDSNAIANKALNLRINVLHANPTTKYDTVPTDIALMANNRDFVRFDSFLPVGSGVAELISVKYLGGLNSPPVIVPAKTTPQATAATVSENYYLPHMFPMELTFRIRDGSLCISATSNVCGLYTATIFGGVSSLTISLIPSISNHASAPSTASLPTYSVTTY